MLSDRSGFVWVEEPKGLRVRPETGQGGFEIPALPYGFSWCSCAISPDATRIAYWTNRTSPDPVELRVVEVTRPTRHATVYKAPPDHRISAAAWSSDGTGIVFSLEGMDPPGSPVGSPPDTSLLVMEATGGEAMTIDDVGGVYVPLGWDRAAGIAAAGISGEGGYMVGYLTVRTDADPTPRRTGISGSAFVLYVDVSSDQRYGLAVFFEPGQDAGTLRWWQLTDFAAMSTGPRMDLRMFPQWRPRSAEIAWIEGTDLQLLDVERGTKRAIPSGAGVVAGFRQDGSAVVLSTQRDQWYALLDLTTGQAETFHATGSLAGSVRFR